ncbi:hypothetical protein [Actinocatenispora comari]|uniref:Uncharacterized protein n=1 Tax=Actinocatenispora comari TaxID=2807577 RepID=A0A8J4A5S0_9ACTN|nr:hypothetical protein [Actinocatenispora comari]GIL25396.1 hypothetical protein NUM_06510 [Actinocatenispora comari]
MDSETAARIARHSWFDSFEELCFSVVEGADESQVIRRFGGDPGATEVHGPERYWQLMETHGPGDIVHLVQVGTAATGQVFAIEINGYTGILGQRSLSRDGARVLTVYTHVNGADRIGYAIDGRQVIDEEPWGPLTPLSDPEPEPAWKPAWCEGLTDPEHGVWLCGARQLVLAERVMGILIEPEWFRTPLRTAQLPDPDDNPVLAMRS